SWQPLREAGATARTMLVAAAAKRWNVDPASCRAQSGEVFHAPTGRSAKYGELAADAARIPVPESVALKRPADFKLIGTPAKRLDAPAKVNGTAVYGIDVRPLGVKIATLAQSPVFGGRLKSVDDTAAKAVKGVRQIVRLDDAIAVVADHMGAAKKGLAALVIEWDDGSHAKLNTQEIAGELEKATLNPGAVAQHIGNSDDAMAGAVTKVEAAYQVPFRLSPGFGDSGPGGPGPDMVLPSAGTLREPQPRPDRHERQLYRGCRERQRVLSRRPARTLSHRARELRPGLQSGQGC
ncbi:MAG TPA: hypothetical protein VNW89_12080, partial [Stellaceae bacterium]|nr:hypothetical protein [Stellaceae bacterium]